MEKTTKEIVAELRQKAAILEFLETLKLLGNTKKEFFFKVANGVSGSYISTEVNGQVAKLPLADSTEKFKELLIKFCENELNPPQEKPVAEA